MGRSKARKAQTMITDVNGSDIDVVDFLLPMYPGEEDVEGYLDYFEGAAKSERWPPERWSELLLPLLPEDYRAIYHLMGPGRGDYNAFKARIVAGEQRAAYKPEKNAVARSNNRNVNPMDCVLWGMPANAQRQKRCLRCSEWGHEVAQCPLSQPENRHNQRDMVANSNARKLVPAVARLRMSPQEIVREKSGAEKVHHGYLGIQPDTDGAERVHLVCKRDTASKRMLPVECVREKFCVGKSAKKQSYFGENFLKSAGVNPVENTPVTNRPVPCLVCGQMGHGMVSCPELWGTVGKEAKPASCFSVSLSNQEDVPVTVAGGLAHKAEPMNMVVKPEDRCGAVLSNRMVEVPNPPPGTGKTVANVTNATAVETFCGTVYGEVGVIPAGEPTVHTQRDLPLYKELFAEEARVNCFGAKMGNLKEVQFNAVGNAPLVVEENCGLTVMGVTTEQGGGASLTVDLAETGGPTNCKESSVREPETNLHNFDAALVGKSGYDNRVMATDVIQLHNDKQIEVNDEQAGVCTESHETPPHIAAVVKEGTASEVPNPSVEGVAIQESVTYSGNTECHIKELAGETFVYSTGNCGKVTLREESGPYGNENNQNCTVIYDGEVTILSKNDCYNKNAAPPLCSVSTGIAGVVLPSNLDWSTEHVDWDSLAKSLLAILKPTSVVSDSTSGAGTVPSVSGCKLAEPSLDEGKLAMEAMSAGLTQREKSSESLLGVKINDTEHSKDPMLKQCLGEEPAPEGVEDRAVTLHFDHSHGEGPPTDSTLLREGTMVIGSPEVKEEPQTIPKELCMFPSLGSVSPSADGLMLPVSPSADGVMLPEDLGGSIEQVDGEVLLGGCLREDPVSEEVVDSWDAVGNDHSKEHCSPADIILLNSGNALDNGNIGEPDITLSNYVKDNSQMTDRPAGQLDVTGVSPTQEITNMSVAQVVTDVSLVQGVTELLPKQVTVTDVNCQDRVSEEGGPWDDIDPGSGQWLAEQPVLDGLEYRNVHVRDRHSNAYRSSPDIVLIESGSLKDADMRNKRRVIKVKETLEAAGLIQVGGNLNSQWEEPKIEVEPPPELYFWCQAPAGCASGVEKGPKSPPKAYTLAMPTGTDHVYVNKNAISGGPTDRHHVTVEKYEKSINYHYAVGSTQLYGRLEGHNERPLLRGSRRRNWKHTRKKKYICRSHSKQGKGTISGQKGKMPIDARKRGTWASENCIIGPLGEHCGSCVQPSGLEQRGGICGRSAPSHWMMWAEGVPSWTLGFHVRVFRLNKALYNLDWAVSSGQPPGGSRRLRPGKGGGPNVQRS